MDYYKELKEYCSKKSIRELKIYIEEIEKVLNNIRKEIEENNNLSEHEINDHNEYIKKCIKNLELYNEILKEKERL